VSAGTVGTSKEQQSAKAWGTSLAGRRHELAEVPGNTRFGVPSTPVVAESGPHPLTGGRYAFGGSRAGNAAARADSWPRLLDFLAAALPVAPR